MKSCISARRRRRILTARARLDVLLRGASMSIGDMELLAGVDISNPAQRQALWSQFRHLFSEEPMLVLGAVMEHCSQVALQRIERGELCLISPLRDAVKA